MAGIGDYEKGKAFSLKSGNKPSFKNIGSSPLKQKPGGGAGEALDHWERYMKQKRDIVKDAPTHKTWGDQYKKTQYKKMLSKDDKGVMKKAMKQLSKKPKAPVTTGFGKKADVNLSKKISPKTATAITSKGKKKVLKKIAGKIATRTMPVVGAGLLAYDVIKTIPKVVKATKEHLKKEAKRSITQKSDIGRGQTLGTPKY